MKYSLKKLIKNIKYLMNSDLYEDFSKQELKLFNDIEENYIYEFSDKLKNLQKPKILDYQNTLKLIVNKPKSFVRLGDGEIDIMKGKDIPFQIYDPKLAAILSTILEDQTTDMYIGINYSYFYDTSYLDDVTRKFYLIGTPQHRQFLLTHCNMNREYINATFNQVYMGADNIDHAEYYNSLKKLFKDKKIVIFAGKGILDDLKYDLFEFSHSKEIVLGPSINAFSDYEEILLKAKNYSKDYILCFILGPTSKALVYQLTKEGYTAWDIGHMAKDYNAFKERSIKDDKFIFSFYAPD